MAPLVSVVTPVQAGRRAVLSDMMQSLGRQTHGEWELVLVTDGTSEYDDMAAPRRIRILATNGLNLAGLRNAGKEAVSDEAEFVFPFDSDDMMAPECLSEHVAAWSPGTVVYSDYLMSHTYDEKTGQFAGRRVTLPDAPDIQGELIESLIEHEFIPHPALYPKPLYDSIWYDETLPNGDDLDIKFAAAFAGARFVRVPSALWCYRWDGNWLHQSSTEACRRDADLIRKKWRKKWQQRCSTS